MYCPQCGQEQASSELRFCSRCGFPLGGVMEIMSNGGLLPQYQPPAEGAPRVSPRRKGVQQGVALVFLAAVLTPIFAVLNTYLGFPELLIALVAILGFIGGPLRILYAAIFEEGAPQKVVYVNQPQPGIPAYPQHQAPLAQRGAADVNRGRALPPQQSIPAPNWRRPDTSELVHPPSVTENTTRLLDKRENEEG